MSQAGIINVIENNPQIPTEFDANIGFAVPLANIINIFGTSVAAASTPVNTTASGNTVTVNVQTSQAIAATDATKIGLAAFDSTDFSVDANGFVTLNGAGAGQTITGDTGGALPPTAGNWNIFGASTAAGTTPVITSGSGSTLTVNVQKTQAIVATNATNVGLAAFNSAHFSVDANGFVSLAGAGLAIDSIGTQTGTNPIVPDASGLVTINGAVVAAGTNPVRSDGTGANTMALEVQISQAIAATDATKIGLANFDSASFGVDANGFVTLSGTGAGKTITGNTGGALSPTAGNWDILGYNSAITGYSPYTTGSASTLRVQMPGTVKWVVNPTANLGTHQTITAALAAASSGDTIFVTPGTYTEDITLKAGVDIVSYQGEGRTPQVTLVGKATATFAGTCTLSGIRLQTNSDFFLVVSGSSATIVNLIGCYLNCSNNTGISFTSSSASAVINIDDCRGNIATTGITYFATSSAGTININFSILSNTGNSTTASTISAGTVQMSRTAIAFPVTTSATGAFNATYTQFSTNATNTTCLTVGGSGSHVYYFNTFDSGSATAVSISAAAAIIKCNIGSSNASTIGGAGTLTFGDLSFTGASSTVSVTTQVLYYEGPRKKIGSTNSGGTNSVTIINNSDTASSNALQQITVAGTSAGDAFTTYTLSGGQSWSHGLDNSASDAYVLSASTALGTTNVMSASTAGEVNWPLQPAFLAYLPSSDNNRTGNGTSFQVGSVTALTEVYDQNGDFNTNGTFTAPVTGRYFISGTVYLSGCTINTTNSINLVTSNRTYQNSTRRTASSLDNVCECSVLADMDANDTFTLVVAGVGEAADTDDVAGSSTLITYMSGALSC